MTCLGSRYRPFKVRDSPAKPNPGTSSHRILAIRIPVWIRFERLWTRAKVTTLLADRIPHVDQTTHHVRPHEDVLIARLATLGTVLDEVLDCLHPRVGRHPVMFDHILHGHVTTRFQG